MVVTLFKNYGMKMQLSKTIYFADYPSSGRTRSGLTIPFAQDESDLYELVKPLSSHAVRTLIGFSRYQDVELVAAQADTPVSTYVRKLLHKNIKPLSQDPGNNLFQIQSTFAGGRGSPLHEWYPYLEGYSPEFVVNVIETFVPHARNILDPFCGSGTTALTTALRGGIGYYAEVNPVCQFVIEAKTLAITLSSKERSRVAERLRVISNDIEIIIQKSRLDDSLKRAFLATFGERSFFESQTFNYVLRTRSFCDALERDDPVVGRFFIVAVLRSLVPCSLLIRRGDLRFRTEQELARGVSNFFQQIRDGLELIASDLIDTSAAPGRTCFVSADARLIDTRIPDHVDAIITSPPYLNGTNYFRNTKIELWFLRHLSTKKDLRYFRDAAITSGINDVTRGKLDAARGVKNNFESETLNETLKNLLEKSYDSRIPAMVEGYFYDMQAVLCSLPKILKKCGIVAIDLGDSVYNDVHVPTHDVLSEIMDYSGFRRDEIIVLRERQSRNGTRLSQTLQIFSHKLKGQHIKTAEINKISNKYLSKWNLFKNQLPHQQGEMSRRNWGHSWHSMCSYQGKLKPAIASCLINALMPQAPSRLLDPFSGVGTIPFEARMGGHEAFGFDINPAAVVISRAKLEIINWIEVDRILYELENLINESRGRRRSLSKLNTIRFNGPLPSYFHKDTLREIVIARDYFQENKPETGASALIFSSLLHILHGNRPYALSRRSHPITPFAPTGPTEYRSLIEKLRQKVERCRIDSATVPTVFGRSFFQDATADWPETVDQLDAIITSPPFFDSTRFHTANWMRLWFAGWEAKDFVSKPATFIDERQKQSFSTYESIFRQANERLKLGGIFAIHVGKSTKCDMAAALQQIGERYLRFQDWFSESVEHCESHGIRDKGTVTHHQYLLFEKANP